MGQAVSGELKGVQAWPTMFFTRRWSSHAQYRDAIIAFLHSLRQQQKKAIESGIAPGAKAATGIYEGDFDLFTKENDALATLVEFMRGSLATAISVANDQRVPPQDIAIEFVDSWYHITNDGGFHDAHLHHGCSWCGIFYLQLGDSGTRLGEGAPNGGSRFYSPITSGGGYRDFGNSYMSSTLDPPIEDGLLLLFPSFLLHSGLPYRGKQDRIVLAFNARALIAASHPSTQASVVKKA